MRAVPGVAQAALVNHLPMTGSGTSTPMRVGAAASRDFAELVGLRTISPAYLATMGISLRRGRAFSDADMDSTARVAIIDKAFAERYFGGRDPLGERIEVGRRVPDESDFGNKLSLTVVGVADDVRQYTLTETLKPTVYVPRTVEPWPSVYLVAQVNGTPGAYIEQLRAAVAKVDPDVSLSDRLIVQDLPALKLPQERFTTTVLIVFACTALIVAFVGVYGFVAYTVTQRRRELVIRVALGARSRAILRQLLVTSLLPATVGVILGIGGAALMSRVVRNLLFGVTTYDPLTFAVVGALVVVVSVVASVLPALRVMNLPPRDALVAA